MRIRLKDGRAFDGTPTEIMSQLRDAWADFMDAPNSTLSQYGDYVTRQLRLHQSITMKIVGTTEDEIASSFIDELQRVGMASQPA